MIRPSDTHTFRLAKNQKNLVVTNIAFRKENLDYFRNRYFENSDSFFWYTGELPFTFHLTKDQLNELSAIVDRLISQPRDYLHLDYLMINIFRIIISQKFVGDYIPRWLGFALENYNTPEQFKLGVDAFIALTKRSVDHVNRTLNKHLKQTLTETVNKAKLEHAARQLTLTNSAIKKIGCDSGFENVSYFHRIFKKYYGVTPKEYRMKNYKIF